MRGSYLQLLLSSDIVNGYHCGACVIMNCFNKISITRFELIKLIKYLNSMSVTGHCYF